MHRWVPGYLAGCALQCPHSLCFPHQRGQKRKKRQCTNVQVWEGGPVWPMQPPSTGPPYSSPLHANQQATWSTYIILASGSKQKRHLLPYPFRPRIPAPSNRTNALRLFALATAATIPLPFRTSSTNRARSPSQQGRHNGIRLRHGHRHVASQRQAAPSDRQRASAPGGVSRVDPLLLSVSHAAASVLV